MSIWKKDDEDDSQSDINETEKKLLDAAEELFVQKGFDGTTIRDITEKAKCSVAAINYSFGDKKQLYIELFKIRLKEMRKTRLRAIEIAMEKGKKLTLEELVKSYCHAFIEPFSDSKISHMAIQLFSRELAEQILPRNMFISEVSAVIESMQKALMTVCPGLSKDDARMGVISTTGQLVHIMQVRILFERANQKFNIDQAINHIIKFSAGGIRACIKGNKK